MVGNGGSSASSYLADPTSPIPSHCAVIILLKCHSALIVVTSILRVNLQTVCLVALAVSAGSSAIADLAVVIQKLGFVMNLVVKTGGFLQLVPNR